MTLKIAVSPQEWKSIVGDGGRQIAGLEDEFRVFVKFADDEIVIHGNHVNCELAKEALDRTLGNLRKEQAAQEWKLSSLYEGWLNKQGGSVKSWRKRYFRLEEGRLLYYQSDELGHNPLGLIPLPGSKLVLENPSEIGRKHVFRITPSFKTSKRTFLLSAPSEKELKGWFHVLKEQIEVDFVHPGSIKEGYMVKCGHRHKSWKTRYFVLTKTQLSYYKEKTDSEPIGMVDLTLPAVINQADTEQHKFLIELQPGYGKRVYLLQATNQSECEAWIEKLKEASKNAREVAKSEVRVVRDGGYILGSSGTEIPRKREVLAPDGYPRPEVI